MSVVAYANGVIGGDRIAITRVHQNITTISDMPKLFVAEAQDFFYGYCGSNMLTRHHATLQIVLRKIITAVLTGKGLEPAMAALRDMGILGSDYLVVTTECVLTILHDAKRPLEHEPTETVAIGFGAMYVKLGYEYYKNFEQAFTCATDYANAKPGGHDFLYTKDLKEFIQCA